MSPNVASQPEAQTHETLAESFAKLALSKNLSKKNINKYRKARSKFIVAEFEDYFRSDTKLENWQMLCDDLGLQGDLSSITKCKMVLRGIWVNIWDFLDAKRMGTQVRMFSSQRLLAKYSIENDLIYPKKAAKESGPLKILLARIFH